MDYENLALQINIDLGSINQVDSDLWKVLVDEYQYLVKKEWFVSVIEALSSAVESAHSFNPWDTLMFSTGGR